MDPSDLDELSLDSRLSRESGCNPIAESDALLLIPVVPAKAGTQGFQSLASGSPLSRGRRIFLAAGFPDSLVRGGDDNLLQRRDSF
jgi:hypothetical protein